MFRLPFLEDTTPPPFYLPHLSDKERIQLDKWFIGTRSQSYYLSGLGNLIRQANCMLAGTGRRFSPRLAGCYTASVI